MGSEVVVAAGDTWGISGPDFLLVYIPFAVLALVVGALLRWRVTNNRGAAGNQGIEHRAELTPPETGMLFDDRRAVLAALAQLRGHDLIDSSGRAARPLTVADKQYLDPFTRSLYDRLSAGSKPTVAALTRESTVPLAQLRESMAERGYLLGSWSRIGLRDAGIPILIVGGFGLIRLIAGLANGNSVGILFAVLIFLVFGYQLTVRPPRLTALGRAARDRATQSYGHLRPANSPAYATYGHNSAAIAVALFGGAALLSLDPGLASAADASGSSGGGGGGDSGGGGSGCGGGGCGG